MMMMMVMMFLQRKLRLPQRLAEHYVRQTIIIRNEFPAPLSFSG
jgi:hypothetical protein